MSVKEVAIAMMSGSRSGVVSAKMRWCGLRMRVGIVSSEVSTIALASRRYRQHRRNRSRGHSICEEEWGGDELYRCVSIFLF